MADPATDAAIAVKFPREWARANDPSLRNRSKARQQLRQRYRIALETEAWREQHPEAACASCRHLGAVNWSALKRCDLDSDFHGDTLIREPETHWCTRWEERA